MKKLMNKKGAEALLNHLIETKQPIQIEDEFDCSRLASFEKVESTMETEYHVIYENIITGNVSMRETDLSGAIEVLWVHRKFINTIIDKF